MSNVFSLYADFDFLSGPPICIGQLECESFQEEVNDTDSVSLSHGYLNIQICFWILP